MNVQELKQTVQNGGRVYGTLVVSNSPHWPNSMKKAGLDFVFLDTEHIVRNEETLAWMCCTYGAVGLVPIVRIPSPDPYKASQVLDGGAGGIVAPYVETVEQVQALRGAVKLKPLKGERLERVLRQDESLEPELEEYLRYRNEKSVLFVNIESTPAIQNLDAILRVPDLDGILIGPHDLSCSLGIPEQYEHPRFTEALKTIIGKTRERGLIAGMHTINSGPVSLVLEWLRMGLNLHIMEADLVYAGRGLGQDLRTIQQELGEQSKIQNDQIIV